MFFIYMQLDSVISPDDLEAILDNPAFMTVINQTGWSPTRPITPSSKNVLIQGLIVDEVIKKRAKQIEDFKKRLSNLGVFP